MLSRVLAVMVSRVIVIIEAVALSRFDVESMCQYPAV